MFTNPYEEKGKIFTQVVHKVSVSVLIQTSTHRIQGNCHIHADNRFSDEFNSSIAFVPLTEVVISDNSGKIVLKSKFLVVNRSQIIWVLPNEDVEETEYS
jgi:hypothetical protein